MRIKKLGKSKRGKWSEEQRAYVSRCVAFGCVACYLGHGIDGTPAEWHHEKERWHGGGMRAPHEYGLALCPNHHDQGDESIHLNPQAFANLIGMSESSAVQYCWEKFGWKR